MGVRRIREADRAVVSGWKRDLWGDDGDGDGDGDGETVLVFESADGGLGGFVALSLRPWAAGCSGSPVPFVEGWFVAPQWRRAGIGRALIEAAGEWARSLGFSELGSDARLDNVTGILAHRRVGFALTQRLQCFRKSLGSEPIDEPRVELDLGDRARLRPLFELAEDSAVQLDSYLDLGRILVALVGPEIVGHLQLIETAAPGEAEIKSLAVREPYQGHGIGRRLIAAALDLAATESVARVLVSTAAADADALRFYQRMGFRMHSVERDAFTPATGYPVPIYIDGIPLRDRVWFDRDVPPVSPER